MIWLIIYLYVLNPLGLGLLALIGGFIASIAGKSRKQILLFGFLPAIIIIIGYTVFRVVVNIISPVPVKYVLIEIAVIVFSALLAGGIGTLPRLLFPQVQYKWLVVRFVIAVFIGSIISLILVLPSIFERDVIVRYGILQVWLPTLIGGFIAGLLTMRRGNVVGLFVGIIVTVCYMAALGLYAWSDNPGSLNFSRYIPFSILLVFLTVIVGYVGGYLGHLPLQIWYKKRGERPLKSLPFV